MCYYGSGEGRGGGGRGGGGADKYQSKSVFF